LDSGSEIERETSSLKANQVSKEKLKSFSIVELKLAIKRIIRCYMNDLDRKPTLKEIDSVYNSAIIEFLEEKAKWFHKEKDDSKNLRRLNAACEKGKKEVENAQLSLDLRASAKDSD